MVEHLLNSGRDVVAAGTAPPTEDNMKHLLKYKGDGKLFFAHIDVSNLQSLKKLFDTFQPESVFHLAAIASHRLSTGDPHPYLHNNYNTVLSVLEAARTVKPAPKIIFTSSSSVYGDNNPPLREDMQPKPKGPYALSKLMGEQLCRLYSEEYGLDCPIVRYFNIVGERCRGNIVFRVFAEKILRGEPLEIYGRYVDDVFRPAERDFTHVSDAIAGTVLVSEKANGYDVFNIGFGRPVSVLRVAELMMEFFNRKKVDVVYKELRPHESLVSYSDNTKAREKLGWSPKTDIEEAVERFVRWVKAGGLRL